MKAEDKNMEFQILEAAEKLFLEQGFAKTSTGQIAKLAGCNQALVHYYYRTKDNLFDKIFEEKIRFITTNFLSVDSIEHTFEKKIEKMIEMHFDFLMQNPKIPAFILNEISSNPDRLQSLIEKLLQLPKSILFQLDIDLKKEIEKGTVREISGIDLLITAISLNLAPFLIKPVLQKALNISDKDINLALEQRKKEIIDTVLSRLKK